MIAERVFTLAELEALLPELSRLVEQQLLLQSEIEKLLADLWLNRTDTPLTTRVEPSDPPKVLLLKRQVSACITRYERGWLRVAELGCTVGDPCVGMVYFYGLVGGRLVALSWCYGETTVRSCRDSAVGFAEPRPRWKCWLGARAN